MTSELLQTIDEYRQLGIEQSINHGKFYLYSLITHSTAIEGSTVTELEAQLLFDEGITAAGRSLVEQMMNVDMKAAYEHAFALAQKHEPFSIGMLKTLAALVMRNTGSHYSTLSGDFDSSKGDLRCVNVSAGVGGSSYMSYTKIEKALDDFCCNLNQLRKSIDAHDILAQYLLSIDAHYKLVTIHPWVDGNGRMSRLVMNMLQYEHGLIPIKISKENKTVYIRALQQSRDEDSLEPFRTFMLNEHIKNLRAEIKEFKMGLESDVPQNVPQNVPQSSLQVSILEMIMNNNRITRKQMAVSLNVSVKTIARELVKMKQVSYVGPSKGGHWVIDNNKD